MGTDDTTTTVAEAPPGPPAGAWDTPIWDGEFADRWARILGGDDGDAEGGDDPRAKPKPPRKRPVKKS